MFYYLFQPLIFIYCARLISFQSNCLDQIWFLTCNQWRSSFWNLTIFLEPFSIINFSFFCYRQFLMIHRIFLCASNCGLLVFFSFNLAHFFSLHAKLCMEQILILFFIHGTCSYLFVQNSVCQPFSVIIFSIVIFIALQIFISHCSWWSCYTHCYFAMAFKPKVIFSS